MTSAVNAAFSESAKRYLRSAGLTDAACSIGEPSSETGDTADDHAHHRRSMHRKKGKALPIRPALISLDGGYGLPGASGRTSRMSIQPPSEYQPLQPLLGAVCHMCQRAPSPPRAKTSMRPSS